MKISLPETPLFIGQQIKCDFIDTMDAWMWRWDKCWAHNAVPLWQGQFDDVIVINYQDRSTFP